MLPDAYMSSFLTRTLRGRARAGGVKERRAGLSHCGRSSGRPGRDKAAAEHRRRLVGGFRKAREAIDAFAPDFVLIWGDDQYENFREDGVPSFCVFALDAIDCRPFGRLAVASRAMSGRKPEKVVRVEGARDSGCYLAAELIKADFDVSYAYAMRHELGLPHAFINTILVSVRSAGLSLSGRAVPRQLLRVLGHRQARLECAS